MVVWHLKQIGKVKKLSKWVPRELTTNQKNCRFEVSSSLILCNNKEPFLDQIVTCNEKWLSYSNRQSPAQWLDWKEAPKHFLQPNLHQKKVMVTVWWSVAGLIHYSFLNPGKTITSEKHTQQITEMHWKLQPLELDWSTERAQFFSSTTPNDMAHNQRLKTEQIGLRSFASSATFPDLSPTDYHFFKHLNNFL